MKRKERRALTWEQAMMLCDELPAYRNLIIFLVQTGVRIGEACGLFWKFVNLSDEWRIVDGEALPPNCVDLLELDEGRADDNQKQAYPQDPVDD